MLPPSAVRLMAALCQLRDELGRPPAMRAVCGRLGMQINAIHRPLWHLRRAGLVRPQEQRDERLAGTTPLYRLEILEEAWQ